MKTSAVIAALILSTGLVHATCSPNPSETVPAFETAKQALLDGEYELFLRTALPLNTDPMADYDRVMGPVEQTFPEGLEGCETVVFRMDDPGYAQEIVMFDAGDSPLVLYMEAALYKGQMTIMSFEYSQSPKEIFQRLN